MQQSLALLLCLGTATVAAQDQKEVQQELSQLKGQIQKTEQELQQQQKAFSKAQDVLKSADQSLAKLSKQIRQSNEELELVHQRQQQLELEAAAFRRLVEHLNTRGLPSAKAWIGRSHISNEDTPGVTPQVLAYSKRSPSVETYRSNLMASGNVLDTISVVWPASPLRVPRLIRPMRPSAPRIWPLPIW